jgi:hypothetical protein
MAASSTGGSKVLKYELKGQRFGMLEVLSQAPFNGKRIRWICRCDCGQTTISASCDLKSGHSQSCGCARTTHGKAGKGAAPEYRSYWAAWTRCTNPKHHNFRHYGGRGIEFRFDSFEAFFAELGQRPKGKTLDRIDVNGHYEPGNVRWATAKEQIANRRRKCF